MKFVKTQISRLESGRIRVWQKWFERHDFIQFLNLLVGILLLAVSFFNIVFSFFRLAQPPSSTDYFYFVCGLMALWAAFTRRKEWVYIVDLLLGTLLITAVIT